jgi:hypothetical protein
MMPTEGGNRAAAAASEASRPDPPFTFELLDRGIGAGRAPQPSGCMYFANDPFTQVILWMATPTPTAGKQPAGSQAVATPPVSTPFSTSHLPAFSPHGPRSVVPSPQQVKKSPANSNTLYGYGSAGGGHPTHSSFGGIGYDSPSAAMALGVGVGELGLDALGPGGSLGATGAGARGDEEERMRKLGMVIDILKTNKGRLSEAGIERLAKRLGLETLWEDQMGSTGRTRTLIIAGSALALDIIFANNLVQKVSLSFPESAEIVTRHTEKAGDILLRDLQFAPNESPLTKMLDKFAANLERLAMLDKLSVIPGLNCHEAIAGIYESLERLHKWEVARLKEQDDMREKGDEFLDRTAMCTKSGKPIMHTRDRLGLSIDYWQEKRRITSRSSKEVRTWSLLVECAAPPMPPFAYTPIRISEKWISHDILKAEPAAEDFLLPVEGPPLDWLEPENTMLPSNEPPKGDAMEGLDQAPSQKYPEVMFVAKFDPPIIVPLGIAGQIFNSTGASMDLYQTSTFDGLMFPHGPEDKIEPGEARAIKHQVQVPVYSETGEKSEKLHNNTLFIDKIDYGRTLAELPFSHPSQLVNMLPRLRQYAFLSTLLQKSFNPSKAAPSPEPKSAPVKGTKKDDFAAFMASASLSSTSTFSVDVSLTTQPPSLKLVFPFKSRTANVRFDINPNGAVEVSEQNLLVEGEAQGEEKLTVGDLGRMLEIAEDLGIWAEYVKRRLG